MCQKRQLLAVLALASLVAFPLSATWTIVAVDPATGEVGGAGASATFAVWMVLGLAPGQGVVAAQAATNEEARLEALRLLRSSGGGSAQAIVQALASPAFDPSRELQQYGLARLGSLGPEAAAFTGRETESWAGSRGGKTYTVQGNILTDGAVVDATAQAFEAAAGRPGTSLAQCLVEAMEAGARQGGDARAGKRRAFTAFLAVAKPGDPRNTASLALVVRDDGQGNPVETLGMDFRAGQARRAVFVPRSATYLLGLGLPLALGLVAAFALRRRSWLLSTLGGGLVALLSFLASWALMSLAGWALWFYGIYALAMALLILVLLVLATGLGFGLAGLGRRLRGGRA